MLCVDNVLGVQFQVVRFLPHQPNETNTQESMGRTHTRTHMGSHSGHTTWFAAPTTTTTHKRHAAPQHYFGGTVPAPQRTKLVKCSLPLEKDTSAASKPPFTYGEMYGLITPSAARLMKDMIACARCDAGTAVGMHASL